MIILYNAANGTNYDDPDLLEINTLEDVVYMGVKNDMSCILDCHMMLLEHQSRFNPNMPIRGFIYYGRLYDKYLERMGARKYGSALVKIPAPRYYVLYNGREDRPERVNAIVRAIQADPEKSDEEILAVFSGRNA